MEKMDNLDLKNVRDQIDAIDQQMVELFSRRMELAGQTGLYKKERGLPLTDPARERAKLKTVSAMAGEKMSRYIAQLYSMMFNLSKAYEAELINEGNEIGDAINNALDSTAKEFPDFCTVACQGVEGAYSQIACSRLFQFPEIVYYKTWEEVFTAIEEGKCRYGVLPIENSTAGSVYGVYDLMKKHKFSIVRAVRLKVDHCLVAKKGVAMGDIREVISHEQAISQCAGFIKSLGNVKVTVCANTAMAARTVAESGRSDIAALSSRDCARLYGLDILDEGVQDQGDNYTRFICISKNLEIYPGADKTSIMLIAAHQPGALYKILSRFYALGINLTKLESRPIPNRSFEFMFYFDIEKSVYSPDFIKMIGELGELSDRYEYLGSYSEVI